MNKLNGKAFRAMLVTFGRKSGNEHKVMLRAVMLDNKIYFSRRKPDGDWFKNALYNPKVKVEFNNSVLSAKANQVTDENLLKKISELKFPGEERAKEPRVVLEVIPDEQL